MPANIERNAPGPASLSDESIMAGIYSSARNPRDIPHLMQHLEKLAEEDLYRTHHWTSIIILEARLFKNVTFRQKVCALMEGVLKKVYEKPGGPACALTLAFNFFSSANELEKRDIFSQDHKPAHVAWDNFTSLFSRYFADSPAEAGMLFHHMVRADLDYEKAANLYRLISGKAQ